MHFQVIFLKKKNSHYHTLKHFHNNYWLEKRKWRSEISFVGIQIMKRVALF